MLLERVVDLLLGRPAFLGNLLPLEDLFPVQPLPLVGEPVAQHLYADRQLLEQRDGLVVLEERSAVDADPLDEELPEGLDDARREGQAGAALAVLHQGEFAALPGRSEVRGVRRLVIPIRLVELELGQLGLQDLRDVVRDASEKRCDVAAAVDAGVDAFGLLDTNGVTAVRGGDRSFS
eukprot:scaffold1307_cov200-Pinguiococcus_pyrenoidosus.AAC.131